MANGLFDIAKDGFLTGSIDWVNDTIKVTLIDTDVYLPNLTTDTTMTDISTAIVGGADVVIDSRSVSGGVASGADVTFTGVTGNISEALVIYKYVGIASSNIPILYIDTAIGLAVTPDSNNILVTWDTGTNKIFKL